MSVIQPLLQSLASTIQRPAACYLIPSIVSTTLGKGGEWLPQVWDFTVASLPPAPLQRSPTPLPALETIPRRRVLRILKEGLVKSSILIGVPKVIEGLLELMEHVEVGAKSDAFVRDGLGMGGEGKGEWNGTQVEKNGVAGLDRVYQADIAPIWIKMQPDMLDVKFLSRHTTYGTILTPHPSSMDHSLSPDPLAYDPALLSIVTLSALIPQRTPREILWHLRGALRQGMSRKEIELIQCAVEEICEACGVKDVGKGMPRVADVEIQKEEK